jgi:putative phage-type endonuclease
MVAYLIQGTETWKAWRLKVIGASDCPAIMGVCPYKTQYQLFEEKMGLREPPVNSAMRYGSENEEKARNEFIDMLGVIVVPYVTVHPKIPYMAASLDGRSTDGKVIVELKCNGDKNHNIAKEGNIPPNHYAQMQHQMEVCGLPDCYYFSYQPGDTVMIKVKRDQGYIDDLLKKEAEFWECIENFTPPPLTKRDYQFKADPTWCDIASDWVATSKELKKLKEKEEDLRDALISLSHGQSSIGGGIKLSKRVRRGAVNYDAIPQLDDVDLNKYRKDNVEYWNIVEG